jgi:hypothetical protein
MKKFTKDELLAAGKRFLRTMFRDEIPGQTFYGPTLGLGIAQELGVRVSNDPQEIDKYIDRENGFYLSEFLEKSDSLWAYENLSEVVEISDLNCGQVAIDFSKGEVSYSDNFQKFLESGTIRYNGFTYGAEGALYEYQEMAKFGLFIDQIQREALSLYSRSVSEKIRSAYWSQNKKIFLRVGELNIILPKTVDDSCKRIIYLIEKILGSSKTQRRNISNLCSSSRNIIRSRMFPLVSYLLTERGEVSVQRLQSLKKMMFDPQKRWTISNSASKAEEKNMPFREWLETVFFAKRHQDKSVFRLLESEDFSSLREFQIIVEEKILNKKKTSWEKLFPEVESNGFVIKQITNSFDLQKEGQEQNHCVASYERRCLCLSTVILSVEGKGRRYTIQLDKKDGQYELTQFKGRFNRRPPEEDYWTVVQIIRQNYPKVVLPEPGSEMIW